MEFIDKQIAPPKSWEKFEELIRALFAKTWEDPYAQRNGRTGQAQHGVDVFGTPKNSPGNYFGVQCKGKEGNYGAKATIAEFDAELAKAERFAPSLAHWTFATTAPTDAGLQRHSRQVSRRRILDGRFPVVTMGWDSILSLLSGHADVVEQFYPEHAGDLPKVLHALRGLPTASELKAIMLALTASVPLSPSRETSFGWSEVRFETARDLGPALMGRPLGPADVAACPVLPEAAEVLADLERAGTARVAGVAGAGKSICVLQAAANLHENGWRVLKLEDPTFEPQTSLGQVPTLFIVDDAHLARPSYLRSLEEQANTNFRVLIAHTIVEGRENAPGTIHLDAKRAVRVIAEGLRARPETTLAAVRRADNRVGAEPGDERLEDRLDHAAEIAQFPWQFCFILGGGWRRAGSLASSARAASADIVLAAAAIRQITSRDARCSRAALSNLIDEVGDQELVGPALEWLVGQRLLLALDDLRCPHQRFAGALLHKVLDGQESSGRNMIADLLRRVLTDPDIPLAGISALLNELSSGSWPSRWEGLVRRNWLDPAIDRCWKAETSEEIRDACWFLNAIINYAEDAMAIFAARQDNICDWIRSAPEGACFALSRLIGHIHNEDQGLGGSMSARIDPEILAVAISTVKPLHACEIAYLVRNLRVSGDQDWKSSYLERIDRPAILQLLANWNSDAWMSSAAELCRHFTYFEPEFGYQLIESLVPAISERLCADPQRSFYEISEIVWDSLRLFDPLHVYVGKNAPSTRMKEVGRKISACWSPADLATKLSNSTPRTFQAAAGVLSFLRATDPKRFKETIHALDWRLIESRMGNGWENDIGDARMLLGVAHSVPSARRAIEDMVYRNEQRITSMSAHLAAVAPASAVRHVAGGKLVRLANEHHVDWRIGMAVLVGFIDKKRSMVSALLTPHLTFLADALSQPSPSRFSEAYFFLRLVEAAAPESMNDIMDRIVVSKAAVGWSNAFSGFEIGQKTPTKTDARHVAAFLVDYSIGRDDSLGELSRKLRREFPKASTPRGKFAEGIELPAKVHDGAQRRGE